MTFPATPLDQTIELYIDGAWTVITSLVYGRDDLVITRGRSDEGTEVDRSTCSATVNNRSGNFSPRNPIGAYFGKIGRNTPFRVRLSPHTPKYLLLAGDTASNASATPPQTEAGTDDTAALSITGDTDIRIDVQPDSWTRFGQALCNKYLTVGDQRSWVFWVNADGTLTFSWSSTGAAGGIITKTSTAAIVVPASGRLALRVTIDVNNGAAGNTVAFYTAPDIAGTWTQLGSSVVTAGTTSIFNSTAQLEIGRAHAIVTDGDLRGRVYGFELRSGIAGSLVADVDFDSQTEAGDTSFIDAIGVPWTLDGDTSIIDPAVRFFGEVSEWPSRWDVSGADVYAPLQASGVLRRLTQGNSPLASTMYRGYTSATFTPKAYWPCEDGEGSTSIASGLAGHPPMTFQSGSPSLAANSDFKCSLPLPTFSESQWTGKVPNHAVTGAVQVWFLMEIPTTGAIDQQGICAAYTSGSGHETRWSLLYATGGDLIFRAFDADGTQLFTNTTAFAVNGKLLRVSIELQQNGADIDWDVATLQVGTDSGLVTSGTLAGRTLGRGQNVVMNAGGDHDDIVIGHISVHDQVRSLFDLSEELNAYSGERAGRRIERLCGEEGLTFRGLGDQETTALMGPQTPSQLVTLLRECAAADGGILYEPRDLYGLAYRPRESMYDQGSRLELDYSAAHLSSIEPTDDDQLVRNDITIRRTDGSSARAVKTEGPLSVENPPDGVGRYDEEVSLNLASDGLLANMAGWRVHLGTVDEARYPVLTVELARSPFVGSSTLTLAAEDLDIGDRLTVENPPAWLPPDIISQLAQGFTETMSNFTHQIAVNCSPERPWSQAAYWDETQRYASSGTCTTTEALDTTETGVDVTATAGPYWTHADGNYNIAIGGEVMTVTGVTGAGPAQTLTVTRSVNGVVKSHLTGAAVELAVPAVYVP